MALAVACGKSSPNPAAPSAASPVNTGAAIDGSTLKANAPVLRSPVNGERLPAGQQVVLTLANSTMTYGGALDLAYEFEIYNESGQRVWGATVPGGSSGTTSVVVDGALEGEKLYRWQARPLYQGTTGPWAALAEFVSPLSEGYIKGNELYDPLINGKTVGQLHGPARLIPGLGVKLESQAAYVSYELQQTLVEGEFSILVTNLATNTEGGKTKLFGMAKGYSDIVTNEYRMTVEKRGDPPGTVAWRFIARDDQIDTEGAEREFRAFDPAKTYLWQATWRNNFFNLLIREGGADGAVIYSKGKHWEGRGYEASPHVIYLGAPVGRSGLDGASVDGVIIRQVWVSGNPRPPQANQ
jgi:hypothetical protein